MAKTFKFKGKTLDELKKMSIKEFGKLLNARARRSLNRGFNEKLKKKIEKARKKQENKTEPITLRTHKRNTIVIPSMVGLKFAIHNGKEFKITEIQPEMLGHYLGEFAMTRKKLVHGKAGIGATRSSTALVTARG